MILSAKRSMLAAAVTLTLAACGGSTATTASTVSSSPSATTAPSGSQPPATTAAPVTTAAPSPTAAGKGPATVALTLTGDQGLAGPITASGIRCNQPSLSGPVIGLFGTPANGKLGMLITLSPGAVTVRLSSGSGATYLERNFTGTGVTGFDTAVGATVDSSLTPAAGESPPASLGVIASMKGSVDCGNQQPGTSTITVTDTAAVAGFGQPLSPVRVECDTTAQGQFVQVIGIAQVGSTPTFVILTASATGLSLAESGPKVTGYYIGSGTGLATLSAGGAHVNGDLIEQQPTKGPSVHMTGDATCGTVIKG